jgi:hypothetical protein
MVKPAYNQLNPSTLRHQDKCLLHCTTLSLPTWPFCLSNSCNTTAIATCAHTAQRMPTHACSSWHHPRKSPHCSKTRHTTPPLRVARRVCLKGTYFLLANMTWATNCTARYRLLLHHVVFNHVDNHTDRGSSSAYRKKGCSMHKPADAFITAATACPQQRTCQLNTVC